MGDIDFTAADPYDDAKLNFDVEDPATWLGTILEIDGKRYQIDSTTIDEWLNDEDHTNDITLTDLESNKRAQFSQDEFYNYLNGDHIIAIETSIEGTPDNSELDGTPDLDVLDE